MILEYLKPDPNIWNGITVIIRAAYYVASLGAAGMALFWAGFSPRLTDADEEWLITKIRQIAIAAIILSLVAAVVRVQILSAGDLTDVKVWEAMFRSRIGDAFFIRMAGLLLIILGTGNLPAATLFTGMGVLMTVASYAAMGHSMLFRPRQELAGIVTIHLFCVAFWVGSLVPLMRLAKQGGDSNRSLIHDWSKLALIAVPVLVASGIWGAVLLVQKPEMLLTSWYGNGFLAKLTLVAGVMAIAALNKLVLTKRLEQDDAAASNSLSRSIRIEIVLMLLVFYAAAEMVSVHPVDLGHRIAP